jgi:hypothetical protein
MARLQDWFHSCMLLHLSCSELLRFVAESRDTKEGAAKFLLTCHHHETMYFSPLNQKMYHAPICSPLPVNHARANQETEAWNLMWPCISYPLCHPSIEVKRGSEQGLNICVQDCKKTNLHYTKLSKVITSWELLKKDETITFITNSNNYLLA